jgi:hypothetical protein
MEDIEPLIQFVSIMPGLTGIEECRPKPSKAYLPSWWKDMPRHTETHITAKQCPAFPDYFSLGYIMPMWTDVEFLYDESTQNWEWLTPQTGFTFDHHGNEQFLDFTSVSFQGLNGNFMFKTHSPWKIITPPGYSVIQLPVFYHFNTEFSVIAGLRDTDVYHSTNHQILYHGNGKRIRIERGTPLCQYIPIKRQDYGLEVRDASPEDEKIFDTEDLNISTKFMGEGVYRKLQKQAKLDAENFKNNS